METHTNRVLKGRIVTMFGSQDAFALAVGVNNSFVSRVVNGYRTLTDEKKKEWAAKLDCEVGEIFPDSLVADVSQAR